MAMGKAFAVVFPQFRVPIVRVIMRLCDSVYNSMVS